MSQLSSALKQATPVTAVRGEGMYLFDESGRSYLDFTAGIGVTSTGHCHPRVVAAAQEQVATLIHGQYTTVMHRPLQILTERLGEVLPPGLDRIFFVNSGSEAVEAALRAVRQKTGRPNVVVFHGGFHGRTVAAASMTTSGARFRSGFSPIMGGVVIAPFPNAPRYGWDIETATDFALQELDYLLETVSDPRDTAAFFIEPVLGEGGYVPANQRFLKGLRERADRIGALLVVDEIQTGFGRTGRFWGSDHFDVEADVLLTAKGLASGFPLSAMITREDIMRDVWPGSQGGTYGGNAVACAAAVATLDVIQDEELVENAAERGDRLRDQLEAIAKESGIISDVRGLGLMIGNEFRDPDGKPDATSARLAQANAAERGLLLLTCGVAGEVVRFIPALIVKDEQVDAAAAIWSESVNAVPR